MTDFPFLKKKQRPEAPRYQYHSMSDNDEIIQQMRKKFPEIKTQREISIEQEQLAEEERKRKEQFQVTVKPIIIVVVVIAVVFFLLQSCNNTEGVLDFMKGIQ